MQQCPRCHVVLPPGAVVCPRCGLALAAPPGPSPYGSPPSAPGPYPQPGQYYPPQQAAPKKSNVGKVVLIIGGVVLGLMLLGRLGQDKKPQPRPATAATASAVATPEERPTPPAPEAPAPEAPAIEVNAMKLWKDYEANEVAADEKYKGKVLLVSGRVDSIDKDFLDNIVLGLRSPNQFMSTHATMRDSQKSAATRLSKGASVSLLCKGGGRVIGSPVLSECVFK